MQKNTRFALTSNSNQNWETSTSRRLELEPPGAGRNNNCQLPWLVLLTQFSIEIGYEFALSLVHPHDARTDDCDPANGGRGH